MSIKRLAFILSLVAGLGLLTAIVFQVFAGLEYRRRELAGLQPEIPPDWMLNGTYVGLWTFVAAAIALVGVGAVAVISRMRSGRDRR